MRTILDIELGLIDRTNMSLLYCYRGMRLYIILDFGCLCNHLAYVLLLFSGFKGCITVK